MNRLLLALIALLFASQANAHQPSDAFLQLQGNGQLQGQLEVALQDLDLLLPLDADENRELTWGELRAQQSALFSLLRENLSLRSDGARCELLKPSLMVNERLQLGYAVLDFTSDCSPPQDLLQVDYRLFAGIDASHRALLQYTAEETGSSAVLDPMAGPRILDVASGSVFIDFVIEGIWHIWIGSDHILFLLALLVAAVYRRGKPVEALGPALWNIAAIVTAFTIAHSITLTLSTLDVVSLNIRLVETLIAISVMLAALVNLGWLDAVRRRWLAFGFGLLHGFGFAAVLGELSLPVGQLAFSLLGFNLGVELGQLAIVLVFVPIAFLLRRTEFYKQIIVRGGSLAVALLAGWWALERSGMLGSAN